jgi:hypothetical protein
MNPLENTARPIAITIIDIFAVFIPGFIWFVLIVTTLQLILKADEAHVVSPLTAWRYIADSMKETDFWLAPLSLAIISVLIGYFLKPTSLTVAELLTRYLFRLQKKTRKIPLCELTFPFSGIYKGTQLYEKVTDLLETRIGCPPENLPGHQPFSAAKRYLRLMSPSLWEESERMEAEVRMIGAVLLASLYSIALSAITLSLQYFSVISNTAKAGTLCWLILSIFTALILAEGFNRLRVREVAYTYFNTLLASDTQNQIK